LPSSLLLGPILFGFVRATLRGPEQTRLVTLMLILQGEFVDSSANRRWEWGVGAWRTALRNPLGLGWGGAGWPHADFLQVAVNLGLLAGLLFLGAYLMTLWHLWQVIRRCTLDGERRALSLAFFLSFAAAGGHLAVQSVVVLPQLALPVWFVWALVAIWMRQQRQSSTDRGAKQ